MNQCHHCGVWVKNATCPLCHSGVADSSSTEKNGYPTYPTVNEVKKGKMIVKVALFIAISLISIALVINLLTPYNLWFIYFVSIVSYVFVTFYHTILSPSHTGGKILVQLVCLSGLLVFLTMLSGGGNWALNYMVPFFVDAATLLITVITLRKQMSWRSYVGYILSMILIGFLPVLLYTVGLVTVLWPSMITALYSFLTLVGMLVFSDTTFKSDLLRRFHL